MMLDEVIERARLLAPDRRRDRRRASKRTIVSLPGDGIGKIVLPEAIHVLEAAGFQADYVHGDIG